MNVRRTSLIAAVAVALPLSLAACGGSAAEAGSGSSGSTTTQSAPTTTSAAPTTAAMAMGQPFGAGCAKVPMDGKGSFAGMATEPVATAASNNPLLKTLVTAVGAAGLGDTLNSAKDITVFAPVDSAFAKLPQATMKAAMADPKGLLTKVLTNHVVAQKLTPETLAGTHQTLGGGEVMVAGSGESFTVDGGANVICGNVQTANATVYIIDTVLVPKA